MEKHLSLIKPHFDKVALLVCAWLLICFFTMISVIIFPTAIIKSAPQIHNVEGVNGYAVLSDSGDAVDGKIFKLRGEWEFYPNRLYDFSDFTTGRTRDPRIARFPHFWSDEPGKVIDRVGYATYRMRVRVPPSFNGIGIYSRFQYSAYDVYLNEIQICGAGVVSDNFANHKAVYLPTNGYTSATIGADGRTFSVILHVQNEISSSGGFANDIFIGSAEAVKNLRTLLLMINGFVSGGMLLLFVCLLLIYLTDRGRTEYRDYTIVALVTLFLSLTNGGESLMYSIGLDTVLLVRLEYCALVIGAFFANYSALKSFVKTKAVFTVIHAYVLSMTAFFLFAPLMISAKVRAPVIFIAVAFFVPPLVRSLKNAVSRPDSNAVISLVSYIIVFAGMGFSVFGRIPWDSVDLFSISMMLHCLLQMLMFLHRYRKTEQTLKEMTETLEERITDRTIELTLTKEKAEAATVAKSNFLATMSHEIRTPMNAIMGISELMRTDNLDKIQLNYLNDIKKSSKALLQIVNDILDFSKIEAGKLEIIPVHFNLMAVYDNICSICQFSADAKNLEFRHYFAPDVPQYIYGDEIRYRQIIINIISNAVKYTKEGYVDFKVEKIDLYGLPFLSFTVADTGIGIKEEDYTRLFSSFEQLDSATNRKIVGTGLGLSIAKLLVTLMNGDIQFESEYGKGTTFTIFLPLEVGDENEAISIQSNYVPVMAHDAHVLVVDDNSINLTVAQGFLDIHGIKPDTALSGPEAIEKIKNKEYDLVFMDHMMPEMDGAQATRIIRSMGGRFEKLHIVALTANAVSGARDVLKEAGMDDFLSKPIDSAHINTILKRWLPAEKLSEGTHVTESQNTDNTGYSEVFDALYHVEGLDVEDGLSHVEGNKPVYLSILRQFCNELDKYILEITSAMDSEDWANYSIKLHAMKGVFANLGESGLSMWAFRLETASKKDEPELCLNETADFCEGMKNFRARLIEANIADTVEEGGKTPIDAAELTQVLTELSSACMLGDSDTAENLCNELNQRSFSEEIDAELKEVGDMIASFDFELVPDKIKDMLARLD